MFGPQGLQGRGKAKGRAGIPPPHRSRRRRCSDVARSDAQQILPPRPASKMEPAGAPVAWFPSLAHGFSPRPSTEGNGLGPRGGPVVEVEGYRPAGSRSLRLGWVCCADSLTVVPSSRVPVIPYFFGLHSRASFWASDFWAGVILSATISIFLTALSRASPGVIWRRQG